LSVSSGNGRRNAFASSHGAHPDVALFIRGQDYRHRFRMNRLDHGVRRGRKEAVIASSRPLFALRITGAG
jgi:hypothetical protein